VLRLVGDPAVVDLRTTPGGEHGRVFEEDDRIRDLVGETSLGQSMHRRVRDVVRDRSGSDQPGG
jgi:hypothetical protein